MLRPNGSYCKRSSPMPSIQALTFDNHVTVVAAEYTSSSKRKRLSERLPLHCPRFSAVWESQPSFRVLRMFGRCEELR
jgi:hypothetical protein